MVRPWSIKTVVLPMPRCDTMKVIPRTALLGGIVRLLLRRRGGCRRMAPRHVRSLQPFPDCVGAPLWTAHHCLRFLEVPRHVPTVVHVGHVRCLSAMCSD